MGKPYKLCTEQEKNLNGSAIQLYNDTTYYDDLLFAAVWLYKASGDNAYLEDAEAYYVPALQVGWIGLPCTIPCTVLPDMNQISSKSLCCCVATAFAIMMLNGQDIPFHSPDVLWACFAERAGCAIPVSL